MEEIQRKLKKFSDEREWERFHTPRNLAESIVLEASELLEHFQWQLKDKKLTRKQLEGIKEEAADVFIYLVEFCRIVNIDLIAATEAKIAKNAKRYPISKARGNAKKAAKR